MNSQYDYKKIGILIGVIVLILGLIVGPSYYFYSKYQRAQLLLKNPNQAAQEQKRAILDKVAKLIDLPNDEDPTLATISDKDKLANQPFFSKAKNGDIVIIYTNTRKAIIYDPLANKIIDVSAISIGSASATPVVSTPPLSPTSTKVPTPQVTSVFKISPTVNP